MYYHKMFSISTIDRTSNIYDSKVLISVSATHTSVPYVLARWNENELNNLNNVFIL